MNAFRAAQQAIDLIEDADAAPAESGQGRTGDAELGKRPPAENEARVEDEINDVGNPK